MCILFIIFIGMGETNAAWNRKIHIKRDSLLAAAAVYRGRTPYLENSFLL